MLREVDKQHRLTRRLASVLHDPRDPEQVRHRLDTMVRQRVFGVAAGYEDLNDHEALRFDQALQTAVDQDNSLAGKSTLCRMEQQADRQAIVKAHELLWHHFIEQHEEPPAEIVLEFDGNDILVHGEQPGKFFNGYYDYHCYFPLYVFGGRHLMVSYLRTSVRSDSHHSWATLALLVRFIRQHWPDTRIVLRGDSHFCRPRMLSWCDRHDVYYIVGISKNSRLLKEVDVPMMLVRATQWQVGGRRSASCQAHSWKYPRWVVARLEESELGSNPRFVINSRYDDGFKLYYEQYCARGDMENRIKDQQLSLFAGRMSSTHWWAYQWRLILLGFAYTLFERLRTHLKRRPSRV